MAPEELRKLSLRSFKTAVYSGIAGAIIIIAIPHLGYRAGAHGAFLIIAAFGIGLLWMLLLGSLFSLVSGGLAWMRGARQCSWIIPCAMILLTPLALWLSA